MMPGCCPGFCTSFNWIHECMGSCICVYVCVIKLMRSCECLPCMYWHSAESSRMALPYTCMESFWMLFLDIASLHDLQTEISGKVSSVFAGINFKACSKFHRESSTTIVCF